MEPSGRTLDEICDYARECFFKKNGYYATEEDAIRLTDEARKAIRAKRKKLSVLQMKQEKQLNQKKTLTRILPKIRRKHYGRKHRSFI